MDRQTLLKVWPEIVQKAWADEEFKARLLENPGEVFKERGIELAEGDDIRVVEEAPGVNYFVLPSPPDGELSLSDLESVSGGWLNCSWVQHSDVKPFLA